MLLATMMLPFQVIMISVYVIFRSLGWLDSWLPLLIMSLLFQKYFVKGIALTGMKG